MLPASYHDLTPIHELMERLPAGAVVYGDKAYNSADEAALEGGTGIRIIPRRRANMAANTLGEWYGLRQYRGMAETANSQLEAWGVQRLHARTHEGWVLKVAASLVALTCINAL